MTATNTAAQTTTIHGWSIPTVCPAPAVLASWGTPKLVAAATIHPAAAVALLEKQEKAAAWEAKQAEYASKPKAAKAPVAQQPAAPAPVVQEQDTTNYGSPAAPTPDVVQAALDHGSIGGLRRVCALTVGLGDYATSSDAGQMRRAILAHFAPKAAPEAVAPQAADAPKAKAGKAEEDRKPSSQPAPGSVDAPRTNPGVATGVGFTTLATATVAQLLAELVSRATTPAQVDRLVNDVADAFEARRATLGDPKEVTISVPVTPEPTPAPKTPEPTPLATAAQAEDAPKAKPGKVPAPKRTDLEAEHATLVAAYKAAKLPMHGACVKWHLETLRAKLAEYNATAAKAETPKPAAPAPKAETPKPVAPKVPAKGTLLIADGKGGTRPATLEELYAAVEAMTAPAAKLAA